MTMRPEVKEKALRLRAEGAMPKRIMEECGLTRGQVTGLLARSQERAGRPGARIPEAPSLRRARDPSRPFRQQALDFLDWRRAQAAIRAA